MTKGLITVFGGSGFIGRYVVRALCKAGYRVRVAVRRPGVAGDLKLSGDVGQVQVMQANVRHKDSVLAALDGAIGAVNLVGILYELGRQTFETTQRDGARNVAEACAEKGLERLVHVSAIGADPNHKSDYAETKGQAEHAVREAFPGAVILRPSIVFGTEDKFFNKLASLSLFTPIMPVVGAKSLIQPVYAGDVARAVVKCIEDDATAGRTFELGGPRAYTMKALTEFVTKTIGRRRLLLPLPNFIAQPLGLLFGGIWRLPVVSSGIVGGPPLTGSQVQMLKSHNIVAEDAEGFAALGITGLETVESVAPTYLYRFRPYGQFSEPAQG